MSTANAWHYTGEIGDPEQAPITAAVWTCGTCGALAAAIGKDQHEQWHRDAVARPTVAEMRDMGRL